MKEKITWKEMKRELIKNLLPTKAIMTFGTIGSCNLDKDIDVIITKKPTSSSDEFYKEIHKIFEKLNYYFIKKYNTKILRFARSEEEFMVKNLKEENKGAILFHTMVYHSMPQMRKDWAWALSPAENIDQILRKNYVTLLGKPEMLFSKEFEIEGYYDNLFTFVYIYDKVDSGYPENIFLEVMKNNLDYLFKKRLGIESPSVNSINDAKKAIYLLAGIIDKLAINK